MLQNHAESIKTHTNSKKTHTERNKNQTRCLKMKLNAEESYSM